MKKLLGRIVVIGLFAAAAVLGIMDTPQGPATAYADDPTATPTPTPEQPDCMSTGCGS